MTRTSEGASLVGEQDIGVSHRRSLTVIVSGPLTLQTTGRNIVPSACVCPFGRRVWRMFLGGADASAATGAWRRPS